MRIIGLPLLKDNYAWLLADEKTGDAAIVDPSEAAPVLELLESEGLTLRWILATHHHWDHTGGIEGIVARLPEVEVICSAYDQERVPHATRTVDDDAWIEICGEKVHCLMVPGHTLGAVAYHFAGEKAVFTGDTLFTAGCGRLFEGSPEQMHASLSRLSALPDDTRVYCGHEYTVANLGFAAHVLPDDAAVADRLSDARARRSQNEPTVPARMDLERRTNPFLRAAEPAMKALTGESEPAKVFAELRKRKDAF